MTDDDSVAIDELVGALLPEDERNALDNTAPWAITALQRNERHRVAALLDENRTVLTGFVKEPAAMLDLVVFLLRLDKP